VGVSGLQAARACEKAEYGEAEGCRGDFNVSFHCVVVFVVAVSGCFFPAHETWTGSSDHKNILAASDGCSAFFRK
jgi:hypothetical protein